MGGFEKGVLVNFFGHRKLVLSDPAEEERYL